MLLLVRDFDTRLGGKHSRYVIDLTRVISNRLSLGTVCSTSAIRLGNRHGKQDTALGNTPQES